MSGWVGMMANVRPLASLGASAVTNSVPPASSRTMRVVPPPGPVSDTSKMRTVWPGTMLAVLGLALKLVDIGPVVLQPSSVPMATVGSPKLFGLATGGFRVRSVVPDNSKLLGSGNTALEGLKRAVRTPVTGEPSPLVGGGVGAARSLLLEPPQAASSSVVDSAKGREILDGMLCFLRQPVVNMGVVS